MEIDTEKLEEIKSELETIKNSINDDFNTIDAELKNLSSYWEGEAALAYIAKANKLSLGFKDYISGLGKLISLLETTVDDEESILKKIMDYITNLFH